MPSKNKIVSRIAAVVSSHGFGHAARACAVLERLKARRPELEIEIFTETPEWFFVDSLGDRFRYNSFPTDVGLVQKTPFVEDLRATVDRITQLFLTPNGYTAELAEKLSAGAFRLVLCDISPLGIRAARKAGIPSLLVENFTWDWIYASFADNEPKFREINPILNSIFASADYHIQTEPVCDPCRCDFVSQPVSRQPRNPREITREGLRIPSESRLILITTGGIEQRYTGLEKLSAKANDHYFVIPGGSSRTESRDNLILLPHHSDFYHPDLVFASDAVVGKLGYSTVAEVFHAGIPFGFVARPDFRETEPLASFVRNTMSGVEISQADFETGSWVENLPKLITMPRQNRSLPNGADEIAQFILSIPGLWQ